MLVRYIREIPPNTTIQHRKNGKGVFYEAEVLNEPITTKREFREYIFEYAYNHFSKPTIYIKGFRAVVSDCTTKLEIELI